MYTMMDSALYILSYDSNLGIRINIFMKISLVSRAIKKNCCEILKDKTENITVPLDTLAVHLPRE